jgi:hypothetical protein
MDATAIADSWRRAFGDAAPLGFACRTAHQGRWLRIHSLPGSRRYPESESDFTELLRRQNEVATTTLGSEDACVLFAGEFADAAGAAEAPILPEFDRAIWVAVPELCTPDDDAPPEPAWIRIAAAPVLWAAGRFDALIRATAVGEAGPVLFANLGTGQAYAPYDGGADLFFRTSQQVEMMRERWRTWLSTRRDGL